MMFLNKRMFKICFSALSFLLCLLIIFNAGIVDCFAVAGIDDGVFWLLVAVMASCGITFSSIDDAHTACDALYLNFDDALKSVIDSVGKQIALDGVGSAVGVKFLQDEWSKIIDSITSTFGNYTGVDVMIDMSSSISFPAGQNFAKTFNISASKSSVSCYKVGNSTITYIGLESDYDTSWLSEQLHYDIPYDYTNILQVVNIANTFYGIQRCGWDSSISKEYPIVVTDYDVEYDSIPFMDWINLFKDGSTLSSNSNIIDMTWTIKDINTGIVSPLVQSGYIVDTDISVSDSICPDGIWTSNKSWRDWMDELIFGDSLGNPSIDVGAYPGNDVWHDGIDDGIGIAVPKDLTNDNIADLSPDTARDYDNTDTKVDTTTGDGDQSDTKPDTKPNNGTPSKILPKLSLPEILFKEKFPFCLPWDVYNLFVGLQSSEAEAPKFVIPYKNNMLGIDEEYTIDLSQFDDAAKIIRFFLGAGFVLALILISRKIVGAE